MKTPVDNIVFVHGGSFENVKKALQQWCDAYNLNIEFHLLKNGRGEHIIVTENSINLEHFEYLVNYLTYPENIPFKGKIIGYKKVNDELRMLFVPEDDSEYDCVYFTTENNQTFKADFGGRITPQPLVVPFLPLRPHDEELPYITVKQHKSYKEKAFEMLKEEEPAVQKRFKYLLWISIGLILSSIVSGPIMLYTAIPLKVCGLFIFTWFFADYKMLRYSRYYFYCLSISLLVSFLAIVFIQIKALREDEFTLLMCSSPTGFLLFQFGLRRLFLFTFKREPVVEKPTPSWQDFIYTMVLIFSTSALIISLLSVAKHLHLY
jgi:hypothetical protein